jgi:hypothetical protein
MATPTQQDLTELATALQKRLDVIADTTWRDADPAAHLEALKSASEHIWSWQTRMADGIPQPLQHFMESQSYHKALAVVQKLISNPGTHV